MSTMSDVADPRVQAVLQSELNRIGSLVHGAGCQALPMRSTSAMKRGLLIWVGFIRSCAFRASGDRSSGLKKGFLSKLIYADCIARKA